MNYVLLDFDGVLTSDSFTRLCVLEHRPKNLFGLDWFDPKHRGSHCCFLFLARTGRRTAQTIMERAADAWSLCGNNP